MSYSLILVFYVSIKHFGNIALLTFNDILFPIFDTHLEFC